jgi:hypothetical protein
LQPQFALLLVQGSQQPVGLLLVGPIIGVIGSLSGVLFGFFLANRQRRRAEEERAKAIRRMLQTEIDHNVKELHDWQERPSVGGFPVQSNQIWDKQLPSIPGALRHEKIVEAHEFYYQRHLLRKFAAEQKQAIDAAADRNDASWPLTQQRYATLRETLEKRVGDFLQTHGNLRVLDEND